MSDVLLRHHPELAPALDGVDERVRAVEQARLSGALSELTRRRELPSASLDRGRALHALQVVVPERRPGPVPAPPARRRGGDARRDVDGQAVGLIDGHAPQPRRRARSGSGSAPTAALLVLATDDVHRVLEGSPDPFASDPEAKRKGMSHFQPDALTISRDELWENRRRFTETVLDTGQARAPARRPLRCGRRRGGGGPARRRRGVGRRARLGVLQRRRCGGSPAASCSATRAARRRGV